MSPKHVNRSSVVAFLAINLAAGAASAVVTVGAGGQGVTAGRA